MQTEDLYKISDGDTGFEVAEGIGKNFDNIVAIINPVIVTMTDGMSEQQLKEAAMTAISALKEDSSRRVVIQYYNSLYPTTTFLSDSEFSISTIEYSPIAINNSENSALVKLSIYCKLSGDTITSVYGGVYNYDFAKKAELNNYLPLSGGKLNKGASVRFQNSDDVYCVMNTSFEPYNYFAISFIDRSNNDKQSQIILSADSFQYMNESGFPREVWHAGNFDPTKVLRETNTYASDLNSITTTSLCKFAPSTTNRPFSYGVCMTVRDGDTSWLSQIAYCTEGVGLFYRNKTDVGAWTAWQKIYTSGNLSAATSSAAGLMSAADKVKLDSLASAMSLGVIDTPTTLDLSTTSDSIDTPSEGTIDSNVPIRALRSAQYQMTTDELLYDALEKFARNHPEYTEFSEWLEAKDAVREQLPYVDETTIE